MLSHVLLVPHGFTKVDFGHSLAASLSRGLASIDPKRFVVSRDNDTTIGGSGPVGYVSESNAPCTRGSCSDTGGHTLRP